MQKELFKVLGLFLQLALPWSFHLSDNLEYYSFHNNFQEPLANYLANYENACIFKVISSSWVKNWSCFRLFKTQEGLQKQIVA